MSMHQSLNKYDITNSNDETEGQDLKKQAQYIFIYTINVKMISHVERDVYYSLYISRLLNMPLSINILY